MAAMELLLDVLVPQVLLSDHSVGKSPSFVSDTRGMVAAITAATGRSSWFQGSSGASARRCGRAASGATTSPRATITVVLPLLSPRRALAGAAPLADPASSRMVRST